MARAPKRAQTSHPETKALPGGRQKKSESFHPAALADHLDAGRKSPFLWSVTANESIAPIAGELEIWHDAARRGKISIEVVRSLSIWLETAIEVEPAEGLRALQALWLLPTLWDLPASSDSDGVAGRALCERILDRTRSLADASTFPRRDTLWWRLLVDVELPLALALVERRKRPAASLDGLAQRVRDLLDPACDTDGVPRAEVVLLLRPIVATLTRSAAWAQALKIKLLVHEVAGLYNGLVEQTLRFTRSDRSALGGDDGPYAWSKRLWELMLATADEDELAAISYRAVKVGRREPSSYADSLRSPSTHSSWGEISLLRSDWGPDAVKLLLTHHEGRALGMELETSERLFRGEWTLRLDRDGRTLEPTADWSVVCWNEDDGVVYLELELEFPGDVKIQRQVLLGGEDRILFVADALLAEQPATWDYRATLPLAEGVRLHAPEKTREGLLQRLDSSGETPVAAIVPLGLPEWRLPRIDAGLEMSDSKIASFARFTGQRAYFPVFLDLKPGRLNCPLTWRQLTVAENLRICSPEIAVAYRVQMAHEQWIFYRSLGPAGNRTFLGQNLVADFYAGQFDAEGIVNDLVRIQEQDD